MIPPSFRTVPNLGKLVLAVADNACVFCSRTSDKQITLNSAILNLLDPYDVVMADRGFIVTDELAAMCVLKCVDVCLTTHYTRGKRQMLRREV